MANNSLLAKFKDKNLFSRLRNQDQAAFISAYDLYVADIYRFVYFKIGKKEEAQDLTSVIFLKTWDYVKTNNLDESKSLRALLYKIARTSIVDYFRQNQPTVSIDRTEAPIDIADENQNVLEQISLNSDLELIRKKLPELKIEYREVLIMRFVNELSLEEIAEITGKTKGNIRVLTFRALKALREAIESPK